MCRCGVIAGILGVVAMVSMPMTAHTYLATFDRDDAGWYAYYFPSYSAAEPTHRSTGGNPGGYISSWVKNSTRFYAFESPSSDFGRLQGGTMGVDYRIDGSVHPSGAKARFYFGMRDGENRYSFVARDAWSWNVHSGSTWTRQESLAGIVPVLEWGVRYAYCGL